MDPERAPNAKLRPLVAPQQPPAQAQATTDAAGAADRDIETVQAQPQPHQLGAAVEARFSCDMT